MSIRVSVYEDNEPLRCGLEALIREDPGLLLTGSYPDGSTLLENCRKDQPEVIVMDIDMPGISGIEATAMVKAAFPEINIMIYTVFEDRNKVFNALCSGASGYLLKRASPGQIVDSIRELHTGGSPMTGEIARMVLDFFTKNYLPQNKYYNLSPRELDVVKGLVKGKSYKMIADSCFISIGTVRSHIFSIYKKLHVNSKSEVVIKAMKERLID